MNTTKYYKKLRCKRCGYVWKTKYPGRIPAKCPSCNCRIFNTNNYEVLPDCFIATVVYGTEYENKINVLRNWRDKYLLKNYFGKKFVDLYYEISPPIADYISDKEILKHIIRIPLDMVIKILKIIYKDNI